MVGEVDNPMDHLDPEIITLFSTWDLSERESHSNTNVELQFAAGDDDGMMFGHMALTHLLNWSLPNDTAINWRHAIRRDSIVSKMTNFGCVAKFSERTADPDIGQQNTKQDPLPRSEVESKFDKVQFATG